MKIYFDGITELHIDLEIENMSGFHLANALNDADEILGYVSFYVISENNRNRIWLNKIATNKEHQNKGVGSKLLEFLECFARQKRAYSIEGKFFPENEFAKSFYENRGYSIEKDGYETFVSKYLPRFDKKDNNVIFKENSHDQVEELSSSF